LAECVDPVHPHCERAFFGGRVECHGTFHQDVGMVADADVGRLLYQLPPSGWIFAPGVLSGDISSAPRLLSRR
jgi:hypothetical protein